MLGRWHGPARKLAPGAVPGSRIPTAFGPTSRRASAARSSAVSSTSSPGRCRDRTGRQVHSPSPLRLTSPSSFALTAATSSVRSTCCLSATAASTASGTGSARASTWPSGRRPGAAGSKTKDQSRRLGRLLDVGGVPGSLDQRGLGTGDARVGAQSLSRIDDLVLGAEDGEQWHPQRRDPLVQRRLTDVGVESTVGVVVGRIGHPLDVVDELVGNVVAGSESLAESLSNRPVHLYPPQTLAEDRRVGGPGDQVQAPVAGVGLRVDDYQSADELGRLLGEGDANRPAQRMTDHSHRPLYPTRSSAWATSCAWSCIE
jgi:hypothetical protein